MMLLHPPWGMILHDSYDDFRERKSPTPVHPLRGAQVWAQRPSGAA